jgi:hypothetical protein
MFRMKKRIYRFILVLCLFPVIVFTQQDPTIFTCTELLGRPTNHSVTVNLCADREAEVCIEYGRQPGNYTDRTANVIMQKNMPCDLLIDRLQANSTYFYRVRYRSFNSMVFSAGAEHSIQTAKPRNTGFTFCVEADPHLDYNTDPELYRLTLANIIRDKPDFLIDLGDSFMSDKLKQKREDSVLYRHLLLRSFFADVCHSLPLYLVLGNHEGESGYWLNGAENNLAVMAARTRLLYFPNPSPDTFYSGNSKIEPFMGLRENYYAWEWGDALFVVLDPYWQTQSRQGDNWRYSLGKEQYDWFRTELEKSHAAFKFVFCHQILGGKDTQGRGGSDYAQYYEMGGLNADSTWGFSEHRPGWDVPLHQLMVKYHVNVFFHGHDHFYACQEKDGVIYQLLPQPGFPGNNSTTQAANYGYLTGKILTGSGYLRVSVTDSLTRIDFIRSLLPAMESRDKKNGAVDYSYRVAAAPGTSTEIDFNMTTPTLFSIRQNYPNPFNAQTTIPFTIAAGGEVDIDVINLAGQRVRTVLQRYLTPGDYTASFEASSLASGLYFYRLKRKKQVLVGKMMYQR